MSAMVINDAKKRNVPGPNAYKMTPILGNIKPAERSDDRQAKFCSFIDEAVLHSSQNPKSKVDNNYNRVDKKARTAVIWGESEQQKKVGARVSPIQKAKGVAPGDFHFAKPEDAFKKTQLPPEHFNFARDKLVNFTEVYSRRKSYVPGTGHYKFDMNNLRKISGSPRSLAVRRH